MNCFPFSSPHSFHHLFLFLSQGSLFQKSTEPKVGIGIPCKLMFSVLVIHFFSSLSSCCFSVCFFFSTAHQKFAHALSFIVSYCHFLSLDKSFEVVFHSFDVQSSLPIKQFWRERVNSSNTDSCNSTSIHSLINIMDDDIIPYWTKLYPSVPDIVSILLTKKYILINIHHGDCPTSLQAIGKGTPWMLLAHHRIVYNHKKDYV